jgi:tetratricopeptide (TPR) repeat protein
VSASETPISLAPTALCGAFSLTLAEWRGLRPGRLAEELGRRLEEIGDTAAGRPIANALGLAVLNALDLMFRLRAAGAGAAATGGPLAPAEQIVAQQLSRPEAVFLRLREEEPAGQAARARPGGAALSDPVRWPVRWVTDEVLAGVADALGGAALPKDFAELCFGEKAGLPGWFPAFTMYLAWQLKTNDAARQSLLAAELEALAELGVSPRDLCDRLYEEAGAIARRFDRYLKAGARPEDASATPAALVAPLAALVPVVASATGTSQRQIAGLAAAVTAKPRPFAELADLLWAHGREAQGLAADLERLGRSDPALAPGLADTLAALHGGDLDGADLRLAALEPAAARGDLAHLRARLAALRGGDGAALPLFEQAVAETQQPDVARARRQLDLARALRRCGEENGCSGPLETAAETLRTLPPAPPDVSAAADYELGLALAAMVRVTYDRKQHEHALAALARARGKAEQAGDAAALGRVHLAIAKTHLSVPPADRAKAAAPAVKAYQAAFAALDQAGPAGEAVPVRIAPALEALRKDSAGALLLDETIGLYEKALHHCSRARNPARWAELQTGLGRMLLRLGQLKGDAAALERAVATIRLALEVRTRQCMPAEWGLSQHLLGRALMLLGERRNETPLFEEAAAASRLVLREITRAEQPELWAEVQFNLGRALFHSGRVTRDNERLAEAVAAFRQSLLERQPGLTAGPWSETQHSLGEALYLLGQREKRVDYFEAAVEAFKAALKERRREHSPFLWALTHHSNGLALTAIGEALDDAERLAEGIEALQLASIELTPEARPGWHRANSAALAKSRQALAKLAHTPAPIE